MTIILGSGWALLSASFRLFFGLIGLYKNRNLELAKNSLTHQGSWEVWICFPLLLMTISRELGLVKWQLRSRRFCPRCIAN